MAIRNPDADFFAALADLGGGNLDDNCAKAANGGGGVQARLGNLKWSESAWWAREGLRNPTLSMTYRVPPLRYIPLNSKAYF